MSELEKWYKILRLNMSYGLSFEDAVENLPSEIKKIFKKYRNKSFQDIEKMFPEYCI